MKKSETKIPEMGMDRATLLQQLTDSREHDAHWQEGRAFCLVYHPGNERAALIQEAYNLFFSENALNPSAFPSLRRMESEVVAMAASLFNADAGVEGTMSSGGTESILLAVQTAREWARVNKPKNTAPEVIVPETVHPAFQKAFHYFGVKGVIAPVGADFRVDVKAVRAAINENTIMLVGSAPSYPHGVVDAIRDLSDMALEHGLLLHVDACVGGFMLPFVRKLGHAVPDYDFALPGVTSISADLHKYGYAAKGASVILYRSAALRKHQFFVYADWPGGIYGSTTMLGTRPGGAIAAAWAALNTIGMNGYMEMAKRTMVATEKIRAGIEAIPELHIIGDPDMSILAFGSEKLNIHVLGDELHLMGWHFDRQQMPDSLHLTISQIHFDVADAFLADLQKAVDKLVGFSWSKVATKAQVAAFRGVRAVMPHGLFKKLSEAYSSGPAKVGHSRSAAMYGMMGALSGSGDLVDMVRNALHGFYSLERG
jgi:sphinganine-1-phosphate aldolase